MLGLLQSTELKHQLPKAQIYQKFELKASQREALDADVAKMEIVNFIHPRFVSHPPVKFFITVLFILPYLDRIAEGEKEV